MQTDHQTCDSKRLDELLGGRLTAAEQIDVEAHLEVCARCRQSLAARAATAELWGAARETLRELDPPLGEPPPDAGDAGIDAVLHLLTPSESEEMLGRLGGYEIQGVVGRGGMGVVLKAQDVSLRRTVAIKVLAPHLASSGAARRQFAREAQAAAAVVHDNVLEIYSVSEANGLPYFVMPYVRGPSLQRRLQDQGPLALAEILRIGAQAANGLAAAHAQGLVHRDVKPANILLADGTERVKLSDFGLARAADDASLTHTGFLAGTPEYMSPEQVRDAPIDARSDLFSLGCVLHALCTGHPPFRAETSYAVLKKVVESTPRSIRQSNPSIPEWFEALVNRLMAKAPEARFDSALEVAELLQACLAHVQAPLQTPLPRSLRVRPQRIPPYQKRLGVCAMLTLLLAAGLFAWQGAAPDISGDWAGEGWGHVVLKQTKRGKLEGTYTDTYGGELGKISLKWSKLEGRYKGTWGEADQDRSGKISVRLVGSEVRGAWRASKKSRIQPGVPGLADLLWMRPDDPRLAKLDIRKGPPTRPREPTPQPPQPAFGHSGRYEGSARMTAIAIAPQGNWIAVGTADARVLLFDSQSLQPRILQGLSRQERDVLASQDIPGSVSLEVRDLAFRHDGASLAVGTAMGTAWIFDVQSGELLRRLDDRGDDWPPDALSLPLAHGHTAALAFSADGGLLATGGSPVSTRREEFRRLGAGPDSGLLKVWNPRTGKRVYELPGEHNRMVSDVAFGHDGKLLSLGHWRSGRSAGSRSNSAGSGIKAWDLATGKVTKVIRVSSGSPMCMALSADRKRMAVGLMEYDKTTDITSGMIQLFYPASGILDLSWKVPRSALPIALSNQHVAALVGPRAVQFWSASSGKPAKKIGGREDEQWRTFALSHDGSLLVVAGRVGKARGFVRWFRSTDHPSSLR